MSRERLFPPVLQMLSLTPDCRAQFLCRETSSFITHHTRAFSHQKTRGGISLLGGFQRTFLLTHYPLKQTNNLLVKHFPLGFLHRNFPPSLSSLSTPSSHVVSVASLVQAQRGIAPHSFSPQPQSEDIYACLLSFPGTPISKTVVLCLLILVARTAKNWSRVTEIC